MVVQWLGSPGAWQLATVANWPLTAEAMRRPTTERPRGDGDGMGMGWGWDGLGMGGMGGMGTLENFGVCEVIFWG